MYKMYLPIAICWNIHICFVNISWLPYSLLLHPSISSSSALCLIVSLTCSFLWGEEKENKLYRRVAPTCFDEKNEWALQLKVFDFSWQNVRFKPPWLRYFRTKSPKAANTRFSRKVLKCWKQDTCVFLTLSSFSKRAFSLCKHSHFTLQNGSFCMAKRLFLESKMAVFGV